VRKLNELDFVILEDWIFKFIREHPFTSVKIISETYGSICGHIVENEKHRETFYLDDKWLDPYL
jgi:hypothetical protein